MAKILLVEDNSVVVKALVSTLEEQQHVVDVARTGGEAKEKIKRLEYDLILLDLILPEISGVELLKTIRDTSDIPVIIISSKTSVFDKSLHLELGADDYMTKPIFPIELIARINAVFRRTKNTFKPSILKYHHLTLDIRKKQVFKDLKPLNLTIKEFNILKLLIEKKGEIVSKREIYETVWQERYFDSENTINVHIKRLRDKIEKDPKNPEIIQTLWGYGYTVEFDA